MLEVLSLMTVRDGKRLYNSRAWRRARGMQLALHPRCQLCRRRKATQVDHIKPVASGGHPFDPRNLQSVCAPCHSRKTAGQDGGFGNRMGRIKGCAVDGSPLDPMHPWFKRQGDQL